MSIPSNQPSVDITRDAPSPRFDYAHSSEDPCGWLTKHRFYHCRRVFSRALADRLEKDARAHEEKARRLRLKSEKLRTRSASACPCDCRGDSEDPQHVEIICNRRAESNSSVNIVCSGASLLCHGYRDVDVLMQSGPDKGKNELFTASSAGSN